MNTEIAADGANDSGGGEHLGNPPATTGIALATEIAAAKLADARKGEDGNAAAAAAAAAPCDKKPAAARRRNPHTAGKAAHFYPFPSDTQLEAACVKILEKCDLSMVTLKQVRLQLEEMFRHKLGSKKPFLKKMITRLYCTFTTVEKGGEIVWGKQR